MTWTVILLGAVCCILIFEVHTIHDSACLGMTAPCGFFSLNCSNGSRIQVDTLKYGTKQERCRITYPECKVEKIGCCVSTSTDSFETFNQDDTNSVLDKCSGRSSCGPLQAVQTNQIQTQQYYSIGFNYVYVDYSCVSGTLYLNLGADITLIEPEVNVIFHSAANDTVFRNKSTNYSCTIVQTGYRVVTLELVDIRIQKHGFTQSCSSVRISIPGANFSAECSNVGKQQTLEYNRPIQIQLDNEWQTHFNIDNMFKQNKEDYPEMIWIKIKGAVWCVQICPVHAIRDSACYGTTLPCDYYRMSCNGRNLIQVDRLQYGMQQGRCQSKNYTKCKVEEIGCCARNSNDCFEDFNQDHTKSVLDKCSGHSSCGPMQAVQARLTQPHNCSSQFSNYVIVDYSCVNGTSLLNLGSDLTLTGPEVNVIFNSAANDTIYRNHSTNYTCTIVQTGYQSVKLELLDIRLQKPGVAQSCSSVKINIPNANFSAKCSEENKQQNTVYMRRSVMTLHKEEAAIFSIDDMFSLNSGDYPVMIWIKFQAYSPYTVNITCRDQKFPDDSGGEPQTKIKDTSNNNTGVILGVLIPVLFLIAAIIVGVVVFWRRHRHIIEKKAVMEFQNNARYGELPMGKPKLEVTLSNSVYTDIDESKIVSNVSATSRECSHCFDQQDEYLVPSQIPEECAPKLDGSSSCSNLGFDQNLKDKSETKPKSDNYVSNISSVQYVNTVDGKSPKKTKASKIERLINTITFGKKDISAETMTESGSKDADAKKTTDKVLKVKRLADDYIEFEQGDLYDKPQEPKVVDKNDIENRQNNLLPSTANNSGKKSKKDIPVVSVYDYADPDGRNGSLPDEDHFMEDNMYEAVDDDFTGIRDDCDKTNEVFTYDYADQESSSIKCYNIDSISVTNKNASFDKSHENIEPPEDSSSCRGVPHNYILPPMSSSSPPPPPPSSSSSSSSSFSVSQVSHLSSPLSSKTSTGSTAYVNSPRVRSANRPITASKPNATDGYANSPNLRAGKRESKSSEMTVNGGDFNDKGNENQSNVVQVILARTNKSVTLSSEA